MQRYQQSVGFSSIQESSKDQLSSVSFSQDTHAGAQEGPDGSAHTSTSQRFLLLWVLEHCLVYPHAEFAEPKILFSARVIK